MQTTTAGHLSNNGGIRGHSAGEFYPYRVMVQGTLDNLRYWIINPQGDKCSGGYSTAHMACEFALIFKEMDNLDM